MGQNREKREEILWDLHQENEVVIPLEFTEEINSETFGLETIKAREMTIGLAVTIAEREVLKNAYIEVIELPINSETLPVFKELRLKIVKNRTQGLDKWKDKEKAFYLAGGNFIQAIYNKELIVNQGMEAKLMKAEKYFENLEKEAKSKLNAFRIEVIRPYIEDVSGLDFSDFTDENFDDFVLGKRTRFEANIEAAKQEVIRIENERLLEIEKKRLAEIENEKIRIENTRLQKEAISKELELQKERKIQSDKDAKIKAENNKLQSELKAKIDAELNLEKERLAKIDADKKAIALAAKAPVKKQLSIWVESFELSSTTLENETTKEIKEKFESFKKWATNQINNL